MNKFNSLIVLILAMLGTACGGSSAPECAFPRPVAIFDTTQIKGITQHSFEAKDYTSSEHVAIPDMAMSLDILQNGCERVVQEYRLQLDGTINSVKTAPQCASLVGDIFVAISELEPVSLRGFAELGYAIGSNMLEFEYDKTVQIPIQADASVGVQLNKMTEPTQTLISVVLFLN